MKHLATIVAGILLTIALAAGAAQAQTADALFASQDLQRVDLFLHSADWLKLRAEFQSNTYYPADLTLNGQTVRNIGIRSRGRGSRSSNKPGLRVDFDRYTTAQRFLGLKSFVLDNVTQDAYPKSIENFQKALAIDKEHADAATGLGVALFNTQKFAEAKANFEIAVKANPQSGFAQYQLGMTSLNLGLMPDAVKALEAYLAAEPNGDKAAEVKATLPAIKAMIK